MKTLAQVLRSRPVYLNDWKEEKKFGIVAGFEGTYMSRANYEAKEAPYPNVELWKKDKAKMRSHLKVWRTRKILFASYGSENYSGDAFVLFAEKGKLYEVNGSHCSCYGLEGQWSPEKTSLKALKHRLEKGTLGKDDWCGNEFAAELRHFLKI